MELATLQAAVRVREPPAVPVVVVHGEAGIGKTSLVAQFASDEAQRGATLLWGTSYEGSSTPYGAWIEALDRHISILATDRLVNLLGTDASVLAALAPSIERTLPGLPPAPELPSADGRSRLFDTVARLLRRLERPLLVLDDLHWADVTTLDLLGHVARIESQLPIVVIVRGASLDRDSMAVQRLTQIERQRRCRYLLLGGLSRDDAARLLARTADDDVDPQLVDTVYAETHGNPFFVRELGRHVATAGAVASGGPPFEVPPTILGAVALRLAPLPEQTRHVLELAAVCTSGFAVTELEALTGLDKRTLDVCLSEAFAADLVRTIGEDRYDFSHALVRQALYEHLSPIRRARIHRRLAEALEHLYGQPPPGRTAAEIARHYRASGMLAGAERAIPYALAAADWAREVHAPADAVALLRATLELVPADDHAMRARLLHGLAHAEAAAAMAGDAASTLEAAIAALEYAGAGPRAIAEVTCDVVSEMWVTIAYLWRVVPLVTRALELLGDQHDLLWARLKFLDRYAHPVGRGPVRIVRLVRPDPEAVAIVRSHGSELEIAGAIEVAGPWAPGELEWLVDQLRHWRSTAARGLALFWIVGRLTLSAPGTSELAEPLCAEAEALADETGALWHRSSAHVNRAALWGIKGRFDAAVQELRSARSVAHRLSEPTVHEPLIASVEALTMMHCDPQWWRAAQQLWRPEMRAFRGYNAPMCAALACYAFARGGASERARQLLASLVPVLCEAEPWDHLVAVSMFATAGAIWELRDAAPARQLLPHAAAVVSAGVPDWYMSSNDLTVARLATAAGLYDQATAAFRRAREQLEGRQLPVRALVDREEAIALRRREDPRADELAAAARASFVELGMAGWLEPPRMAESEELPAGVTRREAEVLRLLASGMSNREIADELALSVYTVERHLNNAYVKISARNRADAAAFVVRHGL